MIGRTKPLTRLTRVGLALVVALALGAGPLLADCQNLDGTTRDCTPSENWRKCVGNARDAYAQCYGGAKTGIGRFLCAAAYDLDVGSCHSGYIRDVFM